MIFQPTFTNFSTKFTPLNDGVVVTGVQNDFTHIKIEIAFQNDFAHIKLGIDFLNYFTHIKLGITLH